MKSYFSRVLLAVACIAAAALVQAAAPPKTFFLSAPTLEEAKESLGKGEPGLQPALDRLRRDADKALQIKPASVMDKSRTPPSGDKHDYLSQAPYFWADPAKADGLPYIRRDGERNPEAEKGTDRAALRDLVLGVRTLSLAYYFTAHEPYAEHAARLLRVWLIDPETRMNPHLEYAQGIPGINTGRGIGIIETAAFGDLCDNVALLAGSKAWTPAHAAGFRHWITAYVTWLITSKNGLEESGERNNHGSWYDAQTAHMALALGERELAKRILAEVPAKRIDVQIQPDGAQPLEMARTKSLSYSLMNLDALMRAARLGEAVGLDLWRHEGPEGQSLKVALKYLAPYGDAKKPWRKKDISGDERDRVPLLLARALPYREDPELRNYFDTYNRAAEWKSERWRLEWNIPTPE